MQPFWIINWVDDYSQMFFLKKTVKCQKLSTLKLNGILLPKLFWPTVRTNCSNDREQLLKFKAQGQEFSKFLRSLEQFIQTVKGQKNFW